jgi:ankyrin repeat protein
LPKATRYNHNYYKPLQLAILKGDWESTKAFLDDNPSVLTAKITMNGQTALHVAALGAQWKVVEKLAQHMPANMVVELDLQGRTCLHYVAMVKSVDTAKALVAINSSVTQIADKHGSTPLKCSIFHGVCKEMIWYLVLNTTDDGPACPFSSPPYAFHLVGLLTAAGFHGN